MARPASSLLHRIVVASGTHTHTQRCANCAKWRKTMSHDIHILYFELTTGMRIDFDFDWEWMQWIPPFSICVHTLSASLIHSPDCKLPMGARHAIQFAFHTLQSASFVHFSVMSTRWVWSVAYEIEIDERETQGSVHWFASVGIEICPMSDTVNYVMAGAEPSVQLWIYNFGHRKRSNDGHRMCPECVRGVVMDRVYFLLLRAHSIFIYIFALSVRNILLWREAKCCSQYFFFSWLSSLLSTAET